MRTREIDRRQWDSYMAVVSNQCLNRPVSIEIQDPAIGAQTIVSEEPFLGISPEEKGSQDCAVDIEIGKIGSTDAYMHEIPIARRVLVEEDDNGVPMSMDIEGEDPDSHVTIKTILTWS